VIEVEVDGRTYILDSQEDVKIDPGDIDGEFIQMGQLLEDYGTLGEHANAAVLEKNYELDRLYAIVDHNIRLEFESAGVKPTVKTVDNSVITNQGYQKVKLELLELTKTAKLIAVVLKAIQGKKECLVSLAANMRQAGELRSLDIGKEYTSYQNRPVLNDEEIREISKDSTKRVARRKKLKQNPENETRTKRTKKRVVRKSKRSE